MKKNVNFLKKKTTKNDILKIDKYLITLLVNSIDINGRFKPSRKFKADTSIYLRDPKSYKIKIIQTLLNSI